jgi:molybdopterin-guanine dinucleotide biosynthesis protein A
LTGIILSGGKNSRMGENKAFLRVNGERLIDRTVRLFRAIFREVIIVTATPLDYLDQPTVVVTDILPEKGALGGIYTGLFFATHEKAFVAACDMPFLNSAFMEYLITRASGYDIVVPETSDGLQPLNAIYSRRCLPTIRGLLDRNRLKIIGFYPGHAQLKISAETIRSYDPEGRMFMNINTHDDLTQLAPALCNTSAPRVVADPQAEIP